tara:strand:- start:104 stop:697 length:594 start_codon:yes stop_codon:yes gene_type:complete
LKRIFDLLVSSTAIVCLSPVFIILYALIRTKLGSPVLFTQVRPGRYGKLFSIIKFRTMLNTRDENGALLPDEDRMTGFGTWLRNSSLDELPELFNVLKGEMSIVGPRPLLIEYLPLYSKEQSRRHNVRPGITGWAQVNGRNAITWDKKFSLDTWYVDNHSLVLDLKIIFLTIKKVLDKSGIDDDRGVGQEKFKGNSN